MNYLSVGLLLSLFSFSAFSNGLSSHSSRSEISNWESDCLEQIKIKSELPTSNWIWHLAEVKPDHASDESSKFSALISGVLQSSESEAVVGSCEFLSGKLTSASLVRRTKIKNPWQDISSMKFFEVQNSLASELDAFFSDTVDEGNIDADVARDSLGNAKVSCNPRLLRKDRGIILFCSFEIVAEVVDNEGESSDEKYGATCSIKWSLSGRINDFGSQYLFNNEDDFSTCAENVSSGD